MMMIMRMMMRLLSSSMNSPCSIDPASIIDVWHVSMNQADDGGHMTVRVIASRSDDKIHQIDSMHRQSASR